VYKTERPKNKKDLKRKLHNRLCSIHREAFLGGEATSQKMRLLSKGLCAVRGILKIDRFIHRGNNRRFCELFNFMPVTLISYKKTYRLQ
jgi:hypothetical protein